VVALLLLAALAATALLAAASARLPSLVSTLLLAYLVAVANVGLVTWVLSPVHGVDRVGLAVAQAVLLAAAFALWWGRGRPRLPLAGAREAARAVAGDRLVLVFLVVAAAVLAYELLLVLTAPPNNWDALTYHLSRAAAWAQVDGIGWIANAPTDRMNEFQPLAEQQLLFLFVASGEGALFGLPQFVAQIAILVAVYGAARRLGFGVRPSACAACLLATLSLIALEAPTAQNDLFAASFTAVAACLLLAGGPVELVAAGVALGVGLGAKLTTLLVWPVLALLLVGRGRRAWALVTAGGFAGFVAIGSWGYVLNVANTGHVLGRGGGRLEATTSPSFDGSLTTIAHVLYRVFDASVLSNGLIVVLAAAGVVLAAAAAVVVRRREGRGPALLAAACVAIPFLAPALVLGAAQVTEWATQLVNLPLHPPGTPRERFNRQANEDLSAFGPVGAVVLLGVPAVVAVGFWRARRVDLRRLALALAVPVFLVLLSLQAKYNPFLARFLIVPVVLTAPLFALYFRRREATAALLVVSALTVALTLADTRTRKLDSPWGRPWELTQGRALRQTWQPESGVAVEELDARVPKRACVGAVLGGDEPAYLLWGGDLDRKVSFLAVEDAVAGAYREGLFYVVISTGPNAWAADEFQKEGWTVRNLGDYWRLAEAPNAGSAECAPA
jgi:hypothetical protein